MLQTHMTGFLVTHGLPHHIGPDLASSLHRSNIHMPDTQQPSGADI
ncbi:hypothetical protein L798_12207 [Zootermopsis nevadensis]|uniref:Uncharacterized protein n=1 Tax=Zootermopsis nevadensis TaxID=136037 RepID=A0A067QVR5_ZOONE|nr:hypothetical protein L798_12207 [Zootermopsis nevadensis]